MTNCYRHDKIICMKKVIASVFICLIMCFAVSLTGCDNEFAKKEYGDNEKIVQLDDRNAMYYSHFKTEEGKLTLTVKKFDGRETLWKKNLDESTETEISIELSIAKGNVKIVYIDCYNNITVLAECSHDISNEQNVTKTISLTNGLNRLKIVGYDCEDIDLKIFFQ